jgi:DNA-directed RNA polymerase specialized sigma24 family protein
MSVPSRDVAEDAFVRFREGDQSAFTPLWNYLSHWIEKQAIRIRPWIFRRRFLEPADFLQDLFLQMRQAGDFQNADSFNALLAIVKKQTASRLYHWAKKRIHKHKVKIDSITILQNQTCEETRTFPSPLDIIVSQETGRRLQELFMSLSNVDQEIILGVMERAKPSEIAARLTSLSTRTFTSEQVVRRRDTITKELKHRMAKECVDEGDIHELFADHPKNDSVDPYRTLRGGWWNVSSYDAGPTASLAVSDQYRDRVDCTVFAPPEVNVGHSLMVQVWAHAPDQAGDAKMKAQKYDDEAVQRGDTSLEAEITRGSTLAFQLSMPGSKIDQRRRSLVWQGKPLSVQFRVVIPKTHADRSIHGTVTISHEEMPIGQITFKLRVTREDTKIGKPPVPVGEARAFESYFVSYASGDRGKVLEKVQMLPRLGKRYFMDVLRLEPGDRWEPKLFVEIDKSDAVLLFWSSNAKKSAWVMRECHYTISTKGIERILPVVIEGPPPVEPPPELAELHLNDPLLYVIYAENEIAKKKASEKGDP